MVGTDDGWDDVWFVLSAYDDGADEREMSGTELLSLIQNERQKQFTGILVNTSAGRFGVFHYEGEAFASYEDFRRQQTWVSWNHAAIGAPDARVMVRLSPADTHDFSFEKRSIVPADVAWSALEDFVTSGSLARLHLVGRDAG